MPSFMSSAKPAMEVSGVFSSWETLAFFSGIGSPEKAMDKLKKEKYIDDYELMFFSEIDKNAVKSYCAIHNVDEKLNLGDITKIKGKDLPYCDLWVGGFPCQDISCAGKMKGFDFDSSTRSSLGWEMIRLLNEVSEKPKYVIFENVSSITSKKFEDTLNLFKIDLISLGYNLYDKILDATDYGIPQSRKRYFLIAILNQNKKFEFPNKLDRKVILKNLLESNVESKYYLSDDNFEIDSDGKILLTNIKKPNYYFEVDLKKYGEGGRCGIDYSTKFKQSARIYSPYGNAPTLMASNTDNNCKIVVEE